MNWVGIKSKPRWIHGSSSLKPSERNKRRKARENQPRVGNRSNTWYAQGGAGDWVVEAEERMGYQGSVSISFFHVFSPQLIGCHPTHETCLGARAARGGAGSIPPVSQHPARRL